MKTISILLLVSVLVFVYAIKIEPYFLQIQKVEIIEPWLESEDLICVQLSDLHLKRFEKYHKKVILKVNDLSPDVIFITGDLVYQKSIFENPNSTEFKQQVEAVIQFINNMHAPLGTFIVRGNNDFGNDKVVSNIFLQKIISATNATVLANQSQYIKVKNDSILLTGIDFTDFDSKSVTHFFINQDRQNSFFQSNSSTRNSYSHLINISQSHLQDYIYSGKFAMSKDAEAIGITFYSQFHHGFDKFYRLRCYAQKPNLHFSSHGAEIMGSKTETDVQMLADTWYSYKIKMQTEPEMTKMSAKVWPIEQTEPAQWQAVAFDSSSTRLLNGTIGLWSAKAGSHYFDDILLETLAGDTLLFEDFQSYTKNNHPTGWLDYNYFYQAIPVLLDDHAKYTILLAHSPEIIEHATMHQIDLVLTGHTHGGQIRLPLIGSILARYKGGPYIKGYYEIGTTKLYVNRGIGTVLVPARLFCRPEITVFHLKDQY